MEAHEHKIKFRISQLRNQIDAIDRILQFDDREMLTVDIRNRLTGVRARSEKLLHKLESGEFEIAIVGNEKTGKSVFANALMGNDILPSADKRCTYTATSIRAGADEATVEFFDAEKFDSDFRDKLKAIGLKDYDKMSFSQTTSEDYQAAWESLDKAVQSANRERNWDLTDILTPENKRVIEGHLGKAPLFFTGQEALRSQDFKKYICEPGYAHAVKKVTVKSSLLTDMPEAVIYDVPGLNSPTRFHKDQTVENMLKADAIVLIVRADEPSFTDSLVEMFDPQKDASLKMNEDGVPLKEKLFVFANKADRASSLAENMQTIRDELEKRFILDPGMFSSRVVCGSAQARLEAIGAVKGDNALTALKQHGIADGIQEIHSKLKRYYENERFRIMEARADRIETDLRAIFRELLDDTYDASLSGEQELIVPTVLDRARKLAKRELRQYRSALTALYNGENHPLTEQLSEDVAAKIQPEVLSVTQEELDAEINKYSSVSQIPFSTAVDVQLREKKKAQAFDAFHNYVTTFAADKHSECEQQMVDILERSLRDPDDLSQNAALTQAVRDYVRQRRAGRLGDGSYNGYYDSLVSRFTVDLFELLLKFPLGDDDRWNKWKTDNAVFFSLAMFAPNKNLRSTFDRQPFHYLLLFHNPDAKLVSPKIAETAKEITKFLLLFLGVSMLSPKLLDMVELLAAAHPEDALALLQQKLNANPRPIFGGPPSPTEKYDKVEKALQELTEGQGARTDLYLDLPTYRSYFQDKIQKSPEVVRNEINEDIRILQVVLRDVAIPAICMEKVFLDLETRTIDNLLNSLEADFRDFVASHILIIAGHRYRALELEREKRRIRAGIRAEIKKALSEFYSPSDFR